MLSTPVGRLRAVGLAEGVSFLALLGIAMPLKYLAGSPAAVTVVGWLHGILFMGFLIVLMQAKEAMGWNLRRTSTVLLAALLPFGPFVIDRRLRKEDEVFRTRGPSS